MLEPVGHDGQCITTRSSNDTKSFRNVSDATNGRHASNDDVPSEKLPADRGFRDVSRG